MTTLKIRELKRAARQLLLGNYTILALVTFLLACSNFFLSSVSLLAVPPIGGWIGRVLDFAALLITNMVYTLLLAGMYYIYYRITEQEAVVRFSDLLFAFRNHPEPVAAFSVLSLVVEYGVLNLLPLSYMQFGRSLPFVAVSIVLLLVLLWYILTFSAVFFFYAADPSAFPAGLSAAEYGTYERLPCKIFLFASKLHRRLFSRSALVWHRTRTRDAIYGNDTASVLSYTLGRYTIRNLQVSGS